MLWADVDELSFKIHWNFEKIVSGPGAHESQELF